jgi:hypothetical protein
VLEKLLEIFAALLIAGTQGLTVANQHADPQAADRAIEAVQAAHENAGPDHSTALARAGEQVTNDRAEEALADAAAAQAAGQAKASTAKANAPTAPTQAKGSKPATVPPGSVTGTSGPPASTPPVPTPPVTIPNH